MKQKLVHKLIKREEPKTIQVTEQDYLIRAREYRNSMTEQLPIEYIDLVKQAKTVLRQTAREYIPKMYAVLKKTKEYSKAEIRMLLIADCLDMWKYNTIRLYFPEEIKDASKQIGAIKANIVLKEKRQNEKITKHKQELDKMKEEMLLGETEHNSSENNNDDQIENGNTKQVLVFEKRIRLDTKLIEHINEKHESSLGAGGKGEVDLVFTENKKGVIKVKNIASIF